MVTKAFEVEQLAPEYQERDDDGTRFMDDIPASDVSLHYFVQYNLDCPNYVGDLQLVWIFKGFH